MKKTATKAFRKSAEGVSWAKEGIEKVRSKHWVIPAGIALGTTAYIWQEIILQIHH